LRIEWHPEALNDLRHLGEPIQRRIKKVLAELLTLEDPRQKLAPYSGNMKGFWKLRIGDHRLVCQIVETDQGFVLVISVAHRSVAYDQPHLKQLENRKN
jgi:mRNA interferase RelE/StbE